MRIRSLRGALALLLLAASLIAFCPAALAFDSDQYYEADTSKTKVYTVQVAATKTLSGAQSIRDKMLKAGFDCFVYKYDGNYRIMCGKFRDCIYDNKPYTQAEYYQSEIIKRTEYSHAYINNAWLPERAVTSFESEYYWYLIDDVYPSSLVYARDQYYECDTRLTKVYTVQIAATKYLNGAESVRDKMLDLGYDCFVYKYDGKYRIMCGKFSTYSEAEIYMDLIHTYTDYSKAYINNPYLPQYAVDYFQRVYYGL